MINFIPKTPEVIALNAEAEAEFESGKELKIEDLIEDNDDIELHYEFYKNVNLFKEKI